MDLKRDKFHLIMSLERVMEENLTGIQVYVCNTIRAHTDQNM